MRRIEVNIPGADNAAGGGDIPALVERLNPGPMAGKLKETPGPRAPDEKHSFIPSPHHNLFSSAIDSAANNDGPGSRGQWLFPFL